MSTYQLNNNNSEPYVHPFKSMGYTPQDDNIKDVQYSIVASPNLTRQLGWKTASIQTIIHTPTPELMGLYELDAQKLRQDLWEILVKNTIIPLCLHNRNAAAYFTTLVGKMIENLDAVEKFRLSLALSASAEYRNKLLDCQDGVQFIREAAKCVNTHPIILALGVGKRYGLNPEFCFRAYAPSLDMVGAIARLPIEDCSIPSFDAGMSKFIKLGEDYISSPDGSIHACIYVYSNESELLFVYATPTGYGYPKACMEVGLRRPPATLLSRYELQRDEYAPLYLILNPELLYFLRNWWYDSNTKRKSSVIISGCYGGNESIKSLVLTDVVYRDVVVIATVGTPEWEVVKYVCAKCEANGANTVSVYPFPIVGRYSRYTPLCLNEQIVEKLLVKAIQLCDLTEGIFVSTIQRDSFSATDANFKWFDKEYGIKTGKILDRVPKNQSFTFTSVDFSDETESPTCYPLKLLEVFSTDSTTLFYGASGVGKSWLLIGLAIAIATGTDFMGMKASEPAKVFYLDGELGRERIRSIVLQLTSNMIDEQRTLVKTNLKFCYADQARNYLDRCDELVEFCNKNKVRVLIVDNLFALAPSSINHQDKELTGFHNRLKEVCTSPINAHHFNKGNRDASGHSSLKALSQNIFRIDNLREMDASGRMIEDESVASSVNQLRKEAFNSKGPFVRITLEKTKVAPEWDKEHIDMWLPINRTWVEISNWPTPKQTSMGLEQNPVLSSKLAEVCAALGPDERKVFEFMLQYPGGVKRINIEQHMGWSGSKTLIILKRLTDKGLVENIGSSRASFYRLVSCA